MIVLIKSLVIAFAMYSKIPMPQVEWKGKSLARALCWFPAVGVVIGGLLLGWIYLAQLLPVGDNLFAIVALLIPILVSGGIHLDGFCDTCDALSSHQNRERKLEILKDSHTGAFAIICCSLYLLFFFACLTEVELSGNTPWMLAIIPILSRSLSGLFATILPNARGSGLLATFTQPIDGRMVRISLAVQTMIWGGALLALNLWTGLFTLVGCGLVCRYYVSMSAKEFGGITGDLAGFFLQLCEVGMLVCLILGQKLEVLL